MRVRVPPRPSGRALRLGGLGFVLGVLGGALAGLLKAPVREVR